MTIFGENLSQLGTILIVNGPSSAGKSSMARAMQSILPMPYQHLQLNAFRDMEPAGYWAERQPDVIRLRVAALCRAMNAALVEYSRHGQNVIFDTVLDSNEVLQYVLKDLAGFPVLLVGVTCEVDELTRRERARGDRELGLAMRQSKRIHLDHEYDFMVNTTNLSAHECAIEVVGWLSQQPEPRAFKNMQSKIENA